MEQFLITVKELTPKGWKSTYKANTEIHSIAISRFRTLVYEQINGRFSQPISITLTETIGKQTLATFSIK